MKADVLRSHEDVPHSFEMGICPYEDGEHTRPKFTSPRFAEAGRWNFRRVSVLLAACGNLKCDVHVGLPKP